MDFEEFRDALDGLIAYDTGCVDSGIHDERLRARVIELLNGDDGMVWLTRAVRETYMTEEAIAQRYSIEDVASLIDWLADRMDFDIR